MFLRSEYSDSYHNIKKKVFQSKKIKITLLVQYIKRARHQSLEINIYNFPNLGDLFSLIIDHSTTSLTKISNPSCLEIELMPKNYLVSFAAPFHYQLEILHKI